MDTSLEQIIQILKKLSMFNLWQFREPLPGHCCTKALSRDNAPLKLAYLLTQTSYWGVFEHFRILMPLAMHSSWPYPRDCLSPWVENIPNARGRKTIGSLGPSYQRHHESWVSLWDPLCAHGILGTPHGEVHDTYGLGTKLSYTRIWDSPFNM